MADDWEVDEHIVGRRFVAADRIPDALFAYQAAVERYRQLGVQPHLAAGLLDVGTTLGVLGRHEEAVVALEESAQLSRQQWETDRSHAPVYASVLLWLGVALEQLEQWDQALQAADTVIALRRSAIEPGPLQVDADLAQALCQYAMYCVRGMRRLDRAQLAMAEAVTIYKAIAMTQGEDCTKELHGAYGVFGAVQLARGEAEDAANIEAYLDSHTHAH